MIESKLGQRIVGVILFLAAVGGTVGMWYAALAEGYYYPKLVAIGPMIAIMSLCMVAFPMDFAKLRAEHGVDKPEKMAHYPAVWKAAFVLAVAAGLGNWYAMSQM
jgi:hypothetical protein